jgi:hypothetical protein
MFMSKSFKVDGIQMSCWGVAQWTCMQHVWEHAGCLETVLQDAIWRCGDLECCGIGTCEMWAKTHWNYFDKCIRKVRGKTLCHLFSKCDFHVIAHMKFFCIQSCVYVIALLASRIVLHVKPLI